MVDGKIYFASGLVPPPEGGATVITREVEVYDISTGEWSSAAPMLIGRGWARAEAVDGKLYVIGGYTGNWFDGFELSDSIEVYDPAVDTWSETSTVPTTRRDFSTAVVDGRVYTIGGVGVDPDDPDTDGRLLDLVQRLDPTPCRPLPPGLDDEAGPSKGQRHPARRCRQG